MLLEGIMTDENTKTSAAEAAELTKTAFTAISGLFSLGAREASAAVDAVRKQAAEAIAPTLETASPAAVRVA